MKKSLSEYRALARLTMKGNYGVMLGAILIVAAANAVLNEIFNIAAAHTTSPVMNTVYITLSAMVTVIIISPLNVGGTGYFLKAVSGDYALTNVFSPFKNNLSNVIKITFTRDVKLMLWTGIPWVIGVIIICVIAGLAGGGALVDAVSDAVVESDIMVLLESNVSIGLILSLSAISMLFAIPGIIKSFEYAMIPYILTEDSSISSKEAFKRTKELMKGNKFRFFTLNLSFIGWYILGCLVFGIGVIFVAPYAAAANAHFYIDIKGGSVSNDIEL